MHLWMPYPCSRGGYLIATYEKKKGSVSATGRYLEPVFGTPQSTRHCRSSQTLRLDTGGHTRPRSPAHGGRREGTGSRSDIDLPTARPGFFPGTDIRHHNTFLGTKNPQMKRAPHLLGARVHTLVHRHVLDDSTERKGQAHVGRPAEAAFINGAAVWNADTTTLKCPQDPRSHTCQRGDARSTEPSRCRWRSRRAINGPEHPAAWGWPQVFTLKPVERSGCFLTSAF